MAFHLQRNGTFLVVLTSTSDGYSLRGFSYTDRHFITGIDLFVEGQTLIQI